MVAKSVVLYKAAPSDFKIMQGGISFVSVSSLTSTTRAPSLSCENLIREINEEMYRKITQNRSMGEEEAH